MNRAIILSGGESKRAGGNPKALMKNQDGRTYLETIDSVLRECGISSLVVLGRHLDEIAPEAEKLGIEIVYNENWQKGMLSSIIKGVEALTDDVDGVLVWPVDCTGVLTETVKSILDASESMSETIIVPCYADRGGHPTYFPRGSFPFLYHVPEGRGADHVVETFPHLSLEVDDRSVLSNNNHACCKGCGGHGKGGCVEE